MAEIQIPEKLTVENMPDDPRECCRWIMSVIGGGYQEYPYRSFPKALCDLVEFINRYNESDDADKQDITDFALTPLIVLGELATDTVRAWEKQLDDARNLARHSVGDWREIDREHLARHIWRANAFAKSEAPAIAALISSASEPILRPWWRHEQ